MISIATIIKLALSLGFTATIEPVKSLEYAVSYYNQATGVIYQCQQYDTDVGKASVCQTSKTTGIAFVLVK